MGRGGGLQPVETVRIAQPASGPVDRPDLPARRAVGRLGRGLTLTVTPLGAFAAGALLVSVLALAWTLGRRMPPEPPPRTPAPASSLDEVRRLPPIPYDQLPVDRGLAD